MSYSGELTRWRERHRRADAGFHAAVAGIDDPLAATPAGAWTAADVVAHVREGHTDEAGSAELGELRMLTLDLAVHAWDIAVSQGGRPVLDDELCTALHDAFAPYAHLMAQEGAFAPPVPIAAGATPLERLIALCGRQPRPPETSTADVHLQDADTPPGVHGSATAD